MQTQCCESGLVMIYWPTPSAQTNITRPPNGHKPLMFLQRYVTIRYTTSLTVPLLWLTAVWRQSHLVYIIHNDFGPAHSAPPVASMTPRTQKEPLMIKIDSVTLKCKVVSHFLNLMEYQCQGLFSGYNKVSSRQHFLLMISITKLWWHCSFWHLLSSSSTPKEASIAGFRKVSIQKGEVS